MLRGLSTAIQGKRMIRRKRTIRNDTKRDDAGLGRLPPHSAVSPSVRLHLHHRCPARPYLTRQRSRCARRCSNGAAVSQRARVSLYSTTDRAPLPSRHMRIVSLNDGACVPTFKSPSTHAGVQGGLPSRYAHACCPTSQPPVRPCRLAMRASSRCARTVSLDNASYALMFKPPFTPYTHQRAPQQPTVRPCRLATRASSRHMRTAPSRAHHLAMSTPSCSTTARTP
jgi:hypothetical protein